ncbi:hypothetical protein PHLGIDRAFT_16347 [Phlebiopsis gigantea 11061_1 CR5-6]|uniref:Uncharacterized protein n=1 Tax=Phlebiopsis gigantea (strain 11061_1 CR5-6) TaxID=745531 RepID=A0A0C3RRJ2_PHLG1|nr:hypothetical protein PHLGIDRAFT_16347 [Phlebiopsis gigantea 11061_1 CR5-6]
MHPSSTTLYLALYSLSLSTHGGSWKFLLAQTLYLCPACLWRPKSPRGRPPLGTLYSVPSLQNYWHSNAVLEPWTPGPRKAAATTIRVLQLVLASWFTLLRNSQPPPTRRAADNNAMAFGHPKDDVLTLYELLVRRSSISIPGGYLDPTEGATTCLAVKNDENTKSNEDQASIRLKLPLLSGNTVEVAYLGNEFRTLERSQVLLRHPAGPVLIEHGHSKTQSTIRDCSLVELSSTPPVIMVLTNLRSLPMSKAVGLLVTRAMQNLDS